MVKTCKNCTHYCARLDDMNSFFHIHDYCKIWKREIPVHDEIGLTDIEACQATCHMFKKVE